jgi:hypothetical protein
VGELENELFLNAPFDQNQIEGAFSTIESYFTIEYFLSDFSKSKTGIHDSWEFYFPQDDLASLVLKISGLNEDVMFQFDQDSFEGKNYLWKLRHRAVIMLYNLTDKTGNWHEVKFKNSLIYNSGSNNDSISLSALSMFYRGGGSSTTGVKSESQQYKDYLKFWTGLVSFMVKSVNSLEINTDANSELKEDIMIKLLIICGTNRDLTPSSLYLKQTNILSVVALNFHWLEQPKIVQNWIEFYEACLIEEALEKGCMPEICLNLTESHEILSKYCKDGLKDGWVLPWVLKMHKNGEKVKNGDGFDEIDYLEHTLCERFDGGELSKFLDVLVRSLIKICTKETLKVEKLCQVFNNVISVRRGKLESKIRADTNKISNKLPKLFMLLGKTESPKTDSPDSVKSETAVYSDGSIDKLAKFLSFAENLRDSINDEKKLGKSFKKSLKKRPSHASSTTVDGHQTIIGDNELQRQENEKDESENPKSEIESKTDSENKSPDSHPQAALDTIQTQITTSDSLHMDVQQSLLHHWSSI